MGFKINQTNSVYGKDCQQVGHDSRAITAKQWEDIVSK